MNVSDIGWLKDGPRLKYNTPVPVNCDYVVRARYEAARALQRHAQLGFVDLWERWAEELAG